MGINTVGHLAILKKSTAGTLATVLDGSATFDSTVFTSVRIANIPGYEPEDIDLTDLSSPGLSMERGAGLYSCQDLAITADWSVANYQAAVAEAGVSQGYALEIYARGADTSTDSPIATVSFWAYMSFPAVQLEKAAKVDLTPTLKMACSEWYISTGS